MLSNADKESLLLPIEETIDSIDKLIDKNIIDSAQLVHELEKDARSFFSTSRWFLHNNGDVLEFEDCETLVKLVISELHERLRGLNR